MNAFPFFSLFPCASDDCIGRRSSRKEWAWPVAKWSGCSSWLSGDVLSSKVEKNGSKTESRFLVLSYVFQFVEKIKFFPIELAVMASKQLLMIERELYQMIK